MAVAKQTGWEIVFTVGGLSLRHAAPGADPEPDPGRDHRQGRAGASATSSTISTTTRGWRPGGSRRSREDWADFPIGSLKHQVNLGRLPQAFALNPTIPNRMVPIVFDPDDFMVLVSGDPLRTNAYAFTHNGYLGFPTGRRIRLPKDWKERLGG